MNDNEDHRNNFVVLATATTTITYLSLDNPRVPYSNKVADRNNHIKWILSSEKRYRWNLHMGREPFHRLCALIKDCDLLWDTRNCSVEEQLMRFLHILDHNVHNRGLEGKYYRSLETIRRKFISDSSFMGNGARKKNVGAKKVIWKWNAAMDAGLIEVLVEGRRLGLKENNIWDEKV
ncbi:hypothetical protein GIB67_016916 [Kingdonia uniflora]|uniref:DUF8040 domain-containing protein n=1 Tax=Kingdonia uniflora TaxID=39325 RepID=A0A7J7M3L8_9MAGN|nr:hypothetical protein GIB67_016916 [Kingdonia uniflora]